MGHVLPALSHHPLLSILCTGTGAHPLSSICLRRGLSPSPASLTDPCGASVSRSCPTSADTPSKVPGASLPHLEVTDATSAYLRYLIGEEGYCLTSLQSALSYVELLPRGALGK